MNLLIKQKQTHRLREGTYSCHGEGWGEGTVREFGVDTYTLLMDNQQEPTVEHMELCSMLSGSVDGRGV